MNGDTRTQDAIGINYVSQVVTEDSESGWQELGPRNDNAVDGIMLLRKRKRDTGAIVFVQVKCGLGYRQDTKKRPNHIGIVVGKVHIDQHLPRWRLVPGPMILIYVDPTKREGKRSGWWVDLRSPEAFTSDNEGIILVPKCQRFGRHSKGDLMKLCGSEPADRDLPVLNVGRADILPIPFSQPIKKQAWKFYREWAQSPLAERSHPKLGEILISRIGWRHMAASHRKLERIIQSWLLLSVAKRMIREVGCFGPCGPVIETKMIDGSSEILDHLRIRARVIFPHRDTSIVQIVLRRRRSLGKNQDQISGKIWLLSIYELRRAT